MKAIPSWNADVAAVTTAVVFGALMWGIFDAVSVAGTLQRQVRDAQDARAAVLRTQLDEETGLRGYVVTGHVAFLQPYLQARVAMDGLLATQRRTLEALGSHVPAGTLLAADAERSTNDDWVRTVAEPLIENSSGPRGTALELEGRRLVDTFRRENDDIAATLSQVAAVADNALATALTRIVGLGLLGALALVVLVRFIASSTERLRRAAERQRLLYENEKRIADALQEAFLQRTLPAHPSVSMHAVYMPAEKQAQVGGDWYDAMRLPNGNLFVSVGDVSGHGVEAAVAMSRARQALITLATLGGSAGSILEQVNRTLTLQGQSLVTAVCCLIDPHRREIEYASAGHPPPVIVEPNASPAFAHGHGIPLGFSADAKFESFTLRPRAGSLLVLYTDGLVEYKRDLIAGEERLLKAAERIAASDAANPALALRDHVFADGKPADDVAVLTIRLWSTETTTSWESVETATAAVPDSAPSGSPSPGDLAASPGRRARIEPLRRVARARHDSQKRGVR